jgi:hypothetical protein
MNLTALFVLTFVKWQAALPFAIAAILSDVVIAVALCVLLSNSRTGYQKFVRGFTFSARIADVLDTVPII